MMSRASLQSKSDQKLDFQIFRQRAITAHSKDAEMDIQSSLAKTKGARWPFASGNITSHVMSPQFSTVEDDIQSHHFSAIIRHMPLPHSQMRSVEMCVIIQKWAQPIFRTDMYPSHTRLLSLPNMSFQTVGSLSCSRVTCSSHTIIIITRLQTFIK